MPGMNHTHSYIRWKVRVGHKSFDKKIGIEPAYRCSHPDCSHYMVRSALFGKRSACPECGTEFKLDSDALKRVKPLCLNCRGTKEGKRFRAEHQQGMAAAEGKDTQRPRREKQLLSDREKAIKHLVEKLHMDREAAAKHVDEQMSRVGRSPGGVN